MIVSATSRYVEADRTGLVVEAAIKTNERRTIQYLVSPISQTLDEAGRER